MSMGGTPKQRIFINENRAVEIIRMRRLTAFLEFSHPKGTIKVTKFELRRQRERHCLTLLRTLLNKDVGTVGSQKKPDYQF